MISGWEAKDGFYCPMRLPYEKNYKTKIRVDEKSGSGEEGVEGQGPGEQ